MSRPLSGPPSARDRLVGLAATLGLLAIVAGLPLVLLAIGASPIPSEMPSWAEIETSLLSPDDGSLALRAVTLIAWLAWAFMALSVLLEIAAQLRGVRPPHLPGLRLPQSAARSMVGTAALLFIAAPAVLQPGQPGAAPPAAAASPPATSSAVVAGDRTSALDVGRVDAADHGQWHGQEHGLGLGQGHGRRSDRVPASVQDDKTVRTKSHPVGPGETLWSIARAHLGDGARYPELVELNPDLLRGGPGFLQVGWVLQVPDEDHADDRGDQGEGAADVELKNGERAITVKPNDTLSEIAQTELEDASAYPEIFKASQGITQPGGVHLTDPDMIDIGWTLIIPADDGAGGQGGPEVDDKHREPRDRGAGQQDPGPQGPGEEDPAGQGDRSTPPGDRQEPPVDPSAGEPDERVVPDPGAAQESAAETSQDDEAGEDEPGSMDAPWLLVGLTGGGAVLAAGLYRGLRTRRRAQFRARRPGRAVAVPGPELMPVEKTINTTGAAAAATVEFMDEALRRLAGQRTRAGQPMPSVAAVELNDDNLVLHLTEPIDLEARWEGTADRMHWRCPIDAALDDLGPDVEELVDQPAPYPMLVTIGSSDAGDVWLLNCEELATLTIAGDPTYGRDFARYLAAELAMNPWSRGIVVDCVGIAEEIAPMERDRIRYHQPGQAGSNAATEVLADAVSTIDRSRAAGTDVVTGRAAQVGEDVWPARLLLVDAATDEPQPLAQLLELVADHAGDTGTAVVIAGDRTETPGTVLHMTSTGRVQLAEAGLDLIAVGLTSDEAHGCAALLAQSEDLHDVEIPVDETAEDGWEVYITRAGSLRPEHTLPRRTTTNDDAAYHTSDVSEATDHAKPGETAEPAESVLAEPDEGYIAAAAVTSEDLDALAPQVPVRVRAEVEAADSTLDEDLADWLDQDSDRPKLTLLGPVGVQAHGKALTGRKAFYTELAAYLALHRRHGVTMDELAEAFNLKPPRVRIDIKVVRDWFGTNPRTGTKHLPNADQAPAARTRGVNVYQVDTGLLVDVDLFCRVRARGQARGPDGIEDLRRALGLVTGRPFDQLRPKGWLWLFEGHRLDFEIQAAVADAAHTVAAHSLEAGDLDLARFAIEKAVLAAPDEDTTQMNRAALAAAEGFPEEAERILRDEVANRSDDGLAPADLTARTEAIIRNHDWQATG